MAGQRLPHSQPLLLETLEGSLTSAARPVLEALCDRTSHHHIPLYLVGGSVRDLLLGLATKDLDFVVEGEALPLARAVSQKLGARVVAHTRFGTATIKLDDGSYDVATARREVYPRPGALPRVTAGPIEDDLGRRDFTMNAMALALTGPQRGALLDPHGGQKDLRRSLVRVLHSNSFVDDPTRLLRAVRYEQRLGFSLEDGTRKLVAGAVDKGALSSVSGDRIRHELLLTMSEPHPHRLLLRLGELSLLDSIFHGLGRGDYLARVGCARHEPLVYLAALVYPLSAAQGEGFIGRLNMPRSWASVVRDTITLRSHEGELERQGHTPSAAVRMLQGRHHAAMRAVALVSSSMGVKDPLERYLDRWRYVRPSLTGRDLAQLGVPVGPLVGEMLEELRRARLDGEVASRQEELALARRLLAAAQDGGTPHG